MLRIQEPAIVERRHSRPAGSTAGSTNRIDDSTQRELLAFERNTGCGRGRGRGGAPPGSLAVIFNSL